MVRVPLLPLRGLNIFPHMSLHFDVGREKSLSALSAAMAGDQMIFLTAQHDLQDMEPQETDVYEVGTLCRVKQVLALPGDHVRTLVEGVHRARMFHAELSDGHWVVDVEELPDYTGSWEQSPELEASRRVFLEMLEEYAKLSGKLNGDAVTVLAQIDDPGVFADTIAADVINKLEDKQAILEALEIQTRMDKLMDMLCRELDIQRIERRITQRVRRSLDKSQKEYYLREQMKAIQNELGEKDAAAEAEELREKLRQSAMPDAAKEKMAREIDRLVRMQSGSPEAVVARTYIDTVLELPWGKMTEDELDLENAARILDEDHYGLQKLKERVLEYLAVCQLKKDMKGPILCFVGPPGTGKTSIAKSIARALGRTFCRMSLGGVRDEAEIRGHRRTYIGAIPGSIIYQMKQAGTMNPVFLLDEIDKMASDFRGDPASAMLEVLDPEQNKAFQDHYLELDFDLSHVLFITTANTTDTIPRPLLDRMEIIEVSSYTPQEKLGIAQQYLCKKQAEEHGFRPEEIVFTQEALADIIDHYTAESGVRGLNREIATVCRKAAKKVAQGATLPIRIAQADVKEYLGVPKYFHDAAELQDKVGVATGLAWTAIGGTTLQIEAIVMPGTGKIELTGQLGDVMKESAMAAISYLRSRQKEWGIDADFYKDKDLHIHIPEGATPKDGPSAGITLATAILSALTGKPVRGDLAMTGEITLRGRVLPVGGIKEKLLAAYRDGIRTILLPEENLKDLEEIEAPLRAQLDCIGVHNMDQVVQYAFKKGNQPCASPVQN